MTCGKHRYIILAIALILLAFAAGYLVYGFSSKCGGFDGIPCPRGFRCDFSEKPGYVVVGELDRCIININ